MSAFKDYLIEEGAVKKRNKAAKRRFQAKVGRVALAAERRAHGVPKSRGSRENQGKSVAIQKAEEVAAARALARGQRTSGFERDPEVTKRIYGAGANAAKHFRSARVAASTEIVGNIILEGLRLFTETKGKEAFKRLRRRQIKANKGGTQNPFEVSNRDALAAAGYAARKRAAGVEPVKVDAVRQKLIKDVDAEDRARRPRKKPNPSTR